MEFSVVRSRRKTMSIQINKEGKVVVRAPLYLNNKIIQNFVDQHTEWIEKKTFEIRQRQKNNEETLEKLSSEEINHLAEKASAALAKKVPYYADIIGVTYGKVTIRCQKTRWGSCSSKGNLNFNCLLMLAPDSVVNYVIVHELCHRKYMNHSAVFWKEVEKYIPDYKTQEQWLKTYGHQLLYRAHG